MDKHEHVSRTRLTCIKCTAKGIQCVHFKTNLFCQQGQQGDLLYSWLELKSYCWHIPKEMYRKIRDYFSKLKQKKLGIQGLLASVRFWSKSLQLYSMLILHCVTQRIAQARSSCWPNYSLAKLQVSSTCYCNSWLILMFDIKVKHYDVLLHLEIKAPWPAIPHSSFEVLLDYPLKDFLPERPLGQKNLKYLFMFRVELWTDTDLLLSHSSTKKSSPRFF